MKRVGALVLLLWAASAGAAAPNDPFFGQQWSLNNDGTQDVSIDLDNLHTLAQKGVPGVDIGWLTALDELTRVAVSPVTVAVIDSGVDPKHADLQGRVLTTGWDFLNNTTLTVDDMGHGTHVSGIIAADAGNALGIAGVAPRPVSILPLRILSKDFKTFSYKGRFVSDFAADAIRYAVAHGATVINMSLGWPKVVNTANVRAAIDDAVQKGVLIVVAAGNDRKDQPTYPCSFEGVLCVGALSNDGTMAMYSNSGGMVDLLAPGDGILSLFPTALESSSLRIQGYEILSGTSQAAPLVSGVAAALRSAYPGIPLSELKARLLISGAPTPNANASLYGLVNLKRALDAQAQPVFLPDFKDVSETPVDESTLRIHGSIAVQNLWQAASQVQARILVNGQAAGEAKAPVLAGGARMSVPWSYAFASLEDSSDVGLQLEISAAGVKPRQFALHFSAARAMQGVAGTRVIALPDVSNWIGNINGQLYSRISSVSSLPAENGMPLYYQQLGAGPAGLSIQLFNASSQQPLTTLDIPAMQTVEQVIHMDVTGSGKRSWIVTGTGFSQGQKFFEFYFLDSDLRPLWGTDAASTWQIGLNVAQAQSIVRDYSAPNSWIKGPGGKLLPCFLAQGTLPDPDNFNRLDPRHYKSDTHLYYLLPQPVAAGGAATALVTRALDDTAFHGKYADTHIRNAVPFTSSGADAGHLRLLLGTGSDLDAPSSLWDIHSLSTSTVVAAPGWDALSTSGLPMQALTSDIAVTLPFFLSFYDPTRGSVSWAGADGQAAGQTPFAYTSKQDAFIGPIAAFDLPLGKFLFLQSNSNLVGYFKDQRQSLPIERDSTFPKQQFSEMFTPVIVGSSARPLPGIYIDSTLVRGNRVSIAQWDPATSRFEKPLRYSLQIPDNCIQMSPVRLDDQVESFALPLVCQLDGGKQELRVVRPVPARY